ncbi:hypothetical protein RIR_jg27099.t1 [Rhizophagus irregularis DAOM 181602=DAOM 197198]|uniref:Uncharacterized protein n=1 Tax=Rhizophagus irregularis (strain DAOM 181602 / DAOM 197198 / MUCL 43194) TaxID=747089 RepID=U9T0R2_RHIID|nr:hypothetical protein RIR_jg27099.t1 [Rhizophagus irregularis DAOM 181602=DAOM 197198]
MEKIKNERYSNEIPEAKYSCWNSFNRIDALYYSARYYNNLSIHMKIRRNFSSVLGDHITIYYFPKTS